MILADGISFQLIAAGSFVRRVFFVIGSRPLAIQGRVFTGFIVCNSVLGIKNMMEAKSGMLKNKSFQMFSIS